MADFIWGIVCGAIGTLAIILVMIACQIVDDHRKAIRDDQS